MIVAMFLLSVAAFSRFFGENAKFDGLCGRIENGSV